MSRHVARRRGFTLTEMMISLLVFSAIAGSALTLFRGQSRAFRMGNDRLTSVQNGRFAIDQLSRDLRTVGTGVTDQQPFMIYAGADVAAFNANLVSNVAGDVFAVYYDPDAPAGSVSALQRSGHIVIPNTAVQYPDTNYLESGVNGSAETIVLFFRLDSSTARTDDYVLYRRVNRQSPELVARNLLQTGTTPFFRYHRLLSPPNAQATIVQIPDAALPVRHNRPIHLAANDTGALALVDSIRAIEVNFTATNGMTGSEERTRAFTRLLRMPNAGLVQKQTCGDQPLIGTTLSAAVVALPSGDPAVSLSWGAATDETGGELDVVRYVIWRRVAGSPDWGDAYLSIPSGLPSYVYQDAAVQAGEQWQYALAAQDCTPSLSALRTSGTVTIP